MNHPTSSYTPLPTGLNHQLLPQETWALITWLVYAGYLHTRHRGEGSAYLPRGLT